MMKIMAVGDIVGSAGVDFFCGNISKIKKHYGADAVIVNGENSAYSGVGISCKTAQALLAAGADIITTGNHAFRSRDYRDLFGEQPLVLRPYNLAKGVPGRGTGIIDLGRHQIGVINLIGSSYMEGGDSYFDALDRAIEELGTKITVVDFHAEATAEKKALGYYCDGRVTALFGTHTHVRTADACVLPKGTGYITDIGMTGPLHSVIGVKAECSIQRHKLKLPTVFEVAEGSCMLSGVVFSVDESTGLCTGAEGFDIS